MHLVLCADPETSTSSILTKDSSHQAPIWEQGRRFLPGEYDLSRLTFESETPHAVPFPDFSRDGHGCPVFSDRLRALLIDSGVDNIDFYPAAIVPYEGSERISGYWAGNIIGLVSCLDRERSEFEEFRGLVKSFDKLVIDESRTEDALIFRLRELRRVMLVDESLGVTFAANAITGLRLIEVEQWDGADGYQ